MKLERKNKALPDFKVALKDFPVGLSDATSEPVMEKKILSKAELKTLLDEKNIAYEPTMKKSELRVLLGIEEESTEDEL